MVYLESQRDHNKPVKAPVTLVHYGKYCTWGVSQELIQHSASPRAVHVLAFRHAPRAIFPRSTLAPVL